MSRPAARTAGRSVAAINLHRRIDMSVNEGQSQQSYNSFLGTEKVSRLLLKFSVPAIISGLVNAIYNIVDQIFIGQGVNEYGMAATNVAFPLVTISISVALLFSVGGAASFNLSIGRKQYDKASKIACNSILALTVCGITLAALATIFLRPLLYAFGATEKIMPYAEPYSLITNIGIPFFVFSSGASNLIRADGSPKYSMLVMLSGAVFNLIADPIFLFVFDMGIEGIALATTLGQFLSFLVAVYYFLRLFKSVPLHKKYFKPDIGIIKSICSLGAASCFNQLAMASTQIVLSNTLKFYGAQSVYGSEMTLAASGAVTKINVILMAINVGIAQGSQPINSYNYGAKKYDRVKETYRLELIWALSISFFAFLIYQIFPRQIIMIFGSDDELFYDFAAQLLTKYMMMIFLVGIHPTTYNFFSSIGKAKLSFWISLSRQIILLIPLLIIAPRIFGLSGVLIAGPIADFLSAVIAIMFIAREIKNINSLQTQK